MANSNPFGEVYHTKLKNQQNFIDYLLNNHGIESRVIQECEWDALTKDSDYKLKAKKNPFYPNERNSQAIRDFLQTHFIQKPPTRLSPRRALRGGKIEVYGLKWESYNNELEDLFNYDVNR